MKAILWTPALLRSTEHGALRLESEDAAIEPGSADGRPSNVALQEADAILGLWETFCNSMVPYS